MLPCYPKLATLWLQVPIDSQVGVTLRAQTIKQSDNVYVYAHVYLCIYVSMYECIYVGMYECIYICLYVGRQVGI